MSGPSPVHFIEKPLSRWKQRIIHLLDPTKKYARACYLDGYNDGMFMGFWNAAAHPNNPELPAADS